MTSAHSGVIYESLLLLPCYLEPLFTESYVNVTPLERTGILFTVQKPSTRFKRESGLGGGGGAVVVVEETVEGAHLKCSFFQNVCVFVVLSFPWWRRTKCSSVE